MNWSNYQLKVFAFNQRDCGNWFVNAVAGSGKTTVIAKCIEDVPFEHTVLAVAFGTDIKKTLEGKLGHLPNVTVKTLNGFGYGACRAAVKRYINVKKTKVEDTLFYDIFGGKTATKEQKDLYYKSRYLISKIIAIWKADMRWEPTSTDMYEVMERFNLNLPKGTTDAQMYDLALATFKKCMAKTMVMDFDDQIAMPLFHGWQLDSYDRVFVDEAQDLTPAQIELTRRAVKCSQFRKMDSTELVTMYVGRAVYVGDPRQAIYQFRGADSNAISNIISTMNCDELPLSICYRCSKAVVRLAQKIVPHIEYHEDSPEGEEAVITVDDFKIKVKEGDLVLSRCTAPLVQACMGFIRDGRKAMIKGREIGQQLIDVIENVADGTTDLESFNDRLCEYVREKEEKLELQKKESALIALNDTFETIVCLYERAKDVPGLVKVILEIFSDDVEGIELMTIHKAKGLEKTNVFIIAPELIPHKLAATEEAQLSEANLAYVAITRAKRNLFRVGREIKLLESCNVESSL